jgi:hypothetical protein
LLWYNNVIIHVNILVVFSIVIVAPKTHNQNNNPTNLNDQKNIVVTFPFPHSLFTHFANHFDKKMQKTK